MKIWNESVSEHSMNLVMIGSFKEVQDADKAKDVIDKFTNYAVENEAALLQNSRFDRTTLKMMEEAEIYTLGRSELKQFMFDAQVKIDGKKIIINTEESDVSAFLKVLIDKGAKVEVYSAHDYPDVAEDDKSE